MSEVLFRIHWLSFTVRAEKHEGYFLYTRLFQSHFGAIESLGHGGRGFKEISKATLGVALYSSPVHNDEEYFHLELPGAACEALLPEDFQELQKYLQERFAELFTYKRLDLAFDNVLFEPKQAEEALVSGQARTLAKRETMRVFSSPFQLRDNGELGTCTVQIGANSSERMLTIYNKRGYVRMEFQARDKRADLIGKQLFTSTQANSWYAIALSHLLDFIEFDTPWWKEFIQQQGRANRSVTTAKEITSERLINWIDNQVSPALSAISDAFSEELIKQIIARGRKRRGSRYDALFIPSKKFEIPDDEG